MLLRLFHASPCQLAVIERRWQQAPTGEWGYFVFAQNESTMAHAYALKNPAVFSVGMYEGWCHVVITPERGIDWERSLHQSERGPGGYIYEVPAGDFKELAGFREWVSQKNITTDPEKTRFVTIEDVMRAGVQIYIVRNIEKYSANSPIWKGNAVPVIGRATQEGALRWLNQERGVNPVLPPEVPVAAAAPVRLAL